MASNQLGYIDSDGHILDSPDNYRPYLPSHLQSRRTLFSGGGDGFERNPNFNSRDINAEVWLQQLDEAGMETTVLYPTAGLGVGFVLEPEIPLALCRAYNDFVHDKYLSVSPRLQAVALLPVQFPDQCADELQRAVDELGFVGGLLGADGPRLLGKEPFHPLYRKAQELDVMLGVHAGGSLRGRGPDEYLFDSLIQAHTLSHPGAQLRQLTSILFEGVPELFPDLRIAFLEAGCTWVPYWMDRMDEEFENRGAKDAPVLTKRPSEYITQGNLFFSCETEEHLLPETMSFVGEDKILYASDFPHWDSNFPHSLHQLLERSDLEEGQKMRILVDNPKRLYGLE